MYLPTAVEGSAGKRNKRLSLSHHKNGIAAFAAVVSAAAIAGLGAGAASAQPACADVHVIGAAGSGERAGDVSADGGMGRVVYKSYRDLAQMVQQDGRTITGEAVAYPATAVPEDGGILDWANFMSSVDAGTEALAQQYQAFVAQCPTTQVVLAGYSQGAMVVHRNLHALDASPNLAAALLVADGDRRPEDPTINLGSVTSVPGAGMGVAQDWPILAKAPAPLPVSVGMRTISVCNLGDAVCDYDPDADDEMNPAAVAVHTSYARNAAAMDSWTMPLYQMVSLGISTDTATAPSAPVFVAAG